MRFIMMMRWWWWWDDDDEIYHGLKESQGQFNNDIQMLNNWYPEVKWLIDIKMTEILNNDAKNRILWTTAVLVSMLPFRLTHSGVLICDPSPRRRWLTKFCQEKWESWLVVRKQMVTPAADVSARVTLIPLSNVIFVQIGKERDRLTFNLEPRSSDSSFFSLRRMEKRSSSTLCCL